LGWVDSFSERAEVEPASDPAIKVRDRKTDPSSQRTNEPFLRDAEQKWNAAIDQYPQKIEPAGDSIGSLGGPTFPQYRSHEFRIAPLTEGGPPRFLGRSLDLREIGAGDLPDESSWFSLPA
jgi:hypothetical protein